MWLGRGSFAERNPAVRSRNLVLWQGAGMRMKMIDEKKRPLFSNKEMVELRKELRDSSGEGRASRLAALDRILANAEADPATFRRFWIQPLLAAGLSLEVAVARVVESYFRPN